MSPGKLDKVPIKLNRFLAPVKPSTLVARHARPHNGQNPRKYYTLRTICASDCPLAEIYKLILFEIIEFRHEPCHKYPPPPFHALHWTKYRDGGERERASEQNE